MTEFYKTLMATFIWAGSVFMTVVAFLIAIKSAHEFYVWLQRLVITHRRDVDLSKRAMVKILGGLTLLSVVWVNGKKFYLDYKNSRQVINVSRESGVIAHKKSGTIHLAGVSKGALPSDRWATKSINLLSYRPYRGSERRVYEVIAREAEKQRNDEVLIYCYLLAIQSSPLSYHLYDKLTRVFGRRKEYLRIEELHRSALESLASMNLNKKSLKRATQEFSMRLDRTRKRPLIS